MWTRDDVDTLYRRHGYAVYARCLRLLQDPAEARDMAHEVFVRVLEKPDAFRGQASPATFLHAIASNLCLNQLRNARSRGAAWQGRAARVAEAWGTAPGIDDVHAARTLVERILGEADPQTAEIALYHFVDELSQGEIAALVGLSRVTVNKRLQQLRAAALSAEGEEP